MHSKVSTPVHWALLTASCLCLVTAACGSSSDGAGGNEQSGAGGLPSGAGGSPHPAGGGAAGVSAANGGTNSAGASGSDQGGAGAAAGGASGTAPAQLFPLAVGNRWTYAVTSVNADCPAGMHDATVAATTTESGELAFDLRDYCRDTVPSLLRVSDGEILEYQGEWARSLAAPLADGYSWAFTTHYQLTWHYLGAVTVAAGTFQNCWQRLNASSTGEALGSKTYCAGVGPVKITYSDEEATLVSYALN